MAGLLAAILIPLGALLLMAAGVSAYRRRHP